MEHHRAQIRGAKSSPGNSAGLRRTRHLQANTVNGPLDSRLLPSTLPALQDQEQDEEFAAADMQSIQNVQASERYPGRGNIQRLREAQTAFSANSEITATTPRRTAWTGEDSLNPPQNRYALNQEHQDQDFVPRLALGSINVDHIGAKEAARRHLLQWNRIYEYNEIQDSSSLEIVAKHRSEARRVYEELLASERDEDSISKTDLISYQNERIQARIALLGKTLLETPEEGCEPMKANITAVLKGYNTGTIGFSGKYTLIYAGHIVDTSCATYSEFTIDRRERLDQYLEEYGPGYLWWEPPLANGREQVLAKKSTVLNLDREVSCFSTLDHHEAQRFQDDACHYKVPLGFRKDDSLRHRRVGSKRRRPVVAKQTRPECEVSKKRKRERKEKGHQESGQSNGESLTARGKTLGSQDIAERSSSPTCEFQRDTTATETRGFERETLQKHDAPTFFFDMLLDSGAELPILLHDDFELLGFSKQDMNAASVVQLSTAAGQTSSALCFELRVGLELQGSPSESWTEQVAYSEAHFFPSRVIKLPPTVETPKYGAFSAERLSGMLPFLAYYMASAPGTGRLCLGEKRAEVLSTENLPAGLAYDAFDGISRTSRANRQEVANIRKLGGETKGLRKVTFETALEDGRKLIDEDVVSERGHEISSSIAIMDNHGSLIHTWNLDYGKLHARREQRKQCRSSSI
ncbi:hypothetical protein N0V82_008979 [Gnomoniopsis sp. IMI 355080]|nr:hypothetical protein N0V82_008979 [Gnomoniopsis sp. IMI 355080]